MKKHITILIIIAAFISNAYNQNCQALYTAIPDSVFSNIYSFIDQSSSTTGNVTEWSWTFQGGTPATSSLQNPDTISWAAPGAYIICLTIFTDDSCSDTYCDSIFINNTTPPCSGFYFAPQITPCSNHVTADGVINLNVYGGSVPYTYLWSTGDSLENLINIPEGTYCVTVTDNMGCKIDTCLYVSSDTSSTCNAYFTDSLISQYTYQFFDNSTSTAPIINWYWDFGDGTNSGDISPVHTFPGPGNYNICLTIMTDDSCTSSYCDSILWNSFCNANFQTINAYCQNCFDFINSSTVTGYITSWYWNFGDGNYSTLQNTEHVYLDSGYYQVCLTITTSDSCISTYCDSVYAQYNLESFSISGQVFYDLTPLSSGTVELYEVSLGNNHPPLFSETVTNGSYLFNNVVSGNYKLLAIPDPPASLQYVSTYYGNVTDWSSAYTLPVFSELISVDINLQASSGVDEMHTNSLLQIFPNPFINNLKINAENEIKSIIIYDVTGALIYSKNVHNRKISISTANLHKGIYLINIKLTDSVYQQKIIKL